MESRNDDRECEVMGRVPGKIAIVTGCWAGLEKAIAALLAKEGARVAITDRAPEGADDVIAETAKAGSEGLFIEQDVSQEGDWKRTTENVAQKFGKVDILLNDAGVAPARTSRILRLRIGAGS
jgi:3(or 17)beta-hydroxysteroid dehydrogenase